MTDRRAASAPTKAVAGPRFPLAELLESLDALLGDPGPAARRRVETNLQTLLVTAGAAGAWLEVDRPPLPRLAFGSGSLPDRAAADRRPNVLRSELVATADATPLGVLWLDGPPEAGKTVARLIGHALDAAWSRARVTQTGARMAALDAATRGIAGVQALDTVLELIVERVRDLIHARYAALGTVDSFGVIERFVTVGIDPEERTRIGAPPHGHGLLGLIIREGRTFRIPNIAAHPDSWGFPPHHPQMQSFLGVPVMVKGASIGNLYLTDKIDAVEFSDEDQALVEMFALHAGIAIENARLHELVQRLVVVEERERIATDLHDGIIQSIYAVGLSLEDLPELMDEDPDEARVRVDRAIDELHVTIRDIRNFIMGLRPELLAEEELAGSIEALAAEVRRASAMAVDTNIDPAAAAVLPEHARAPIVHITREALSNVVRHSQASRVSVVLSRDRGSVRLEISDNGIGFDPGQQRAPGHQGLTNMAGRATRHGGQFTIDTAVGAGTRIIVTLGERTGLSDLPRSTEASQQEAR